MHPQKRLSCCLLFAMGLIIFLLNTCRKEKYVPRTDNVMIQTQQDTCKSIQANFSSEVKPLLISSCADPMLGHCHHKGSDHGDFYDLTALQDFASSGKLWQYVKTGMMPPSYTNGKRKLDASEILLIRCWILQGMPMGDEIENK